MTFCVVLLGCRLQPTLALRRQRRSVGDSFSSSAEEGDDAFEEAEEDEEDDLYSVGGVERHRESVEIYNSLDRQQIDVAAYVHQVFLASSFLALCVCVCVCVYHGRLG